MRARTRRFRISPFLLLGLPAMLQLFIFAYLPLSGLLIAFENYNVTKGVFGSPLVGFDNFQFVLSSGDLPHLVFNTMWLNLWFIVGVQGTGVLLALLLNEIGRAWFKRLTQSFVSLTWFISWVVISMMVQALFGGTSTPPATSWLNDLGLPAYNWYSDPQPWGLLLTSIRVWQGAGYASIIYLASITSIPGETYEAAAIDGASRLAMITRITLPLLVPTLAIIGLLQLGRIFFGDFQMMYAMVGNNSLLWPTTDVIDTYVFRGLQQNPDWGIPAATGLTQSVLGFILVLIANYFVRRRYGDAALF